MRQPTVESSCVFVTAILRPAAVQQPLMTASADSVLFLSRLHICGFIRKLRPVKLCRNPKTSKRHNTQSVSYVSSSTAQPCRVLTVQLYFTYYTYTLYQRCFNADSECSVGMNCCIQYNILCAHAYDFAFKQMCIRFARSAASAASDETRLNSSSFDSRLALKNCRITGHIMFAVVLNHPRCCHGNHECRPINQN